MMGSTGNPKSWAPFVNNKDCSQGFCSLYCQQWCYIIFPPPPSLNFPDDDHRRGSVPTFSPLVIAIIGILASALLLVSYYSLISKYCGNTSSPSRRREDDYLEEELEENNIQSPNLHQPWHVSSTGGLDEALIKSITTCKYKKGDGLIVEGSDCSVCLSEFNEDENIKLLPKCSHAFHVHCIDTWLKSHSNCPLCRANIIFVTPSLPPLLATPTNGEIQQNNETTSEVNVLEASNIETNNEEEENVGTSRVLSDNIEGRKDTIIQMTEESGFQGIQRSFSMDHYSCHQTRVSIADILHMDARDEDQCCNTSSERISKHNLGEISKYNRERRKVLHCVMDSVAMKRSFSSGRLSLTRQGRVRDTIIPL